MFAAPVNIKRKTRWIYILVFFFLIIPGVLLAGATRMVVGLDGEKTVIPVSPQRIACFYHLAYDKIVMLSQGSRIAMMPQKATPWASKFYPELRGIPTAAFSAVPDVERLLKLNVDFVFYPKGHINIDKVVQAGIPAVCPFNDRFTPATMEDYTTEFKRQILFFGEVLGPDARLRAENYCKYLDRITVRVAAITSKIPQSRKPKVYYGKVTDLYATQGSNTVMRWYTELAGGIYLPGKLPKYFAEVNMETIIAWNPDIILLGTYGSFDAAVNHFPVKTLKAYTSGNVYRIPAGVFFWDMTSCETALLPLFLGKTFHPRLFKDWDIISEMIRFYSSIYHIDITKRDAQRILDGLGPL